MQSLRTIEQLALKSTDITAITSKVIAKFVEEAARPHLYGRQLLRLNTQLERTQGTSVRALTLKRGFKRCLGKCKA